MSIKSIHICYRFSNIIITDYPKVSYLAKDWLAFVHEFRSVASSQGFDYIFQDGEFESVTENENKLQVGLYIYIWCFPQLLGRLHKFLLVEQNKPIKNGWKVYL